MLREKWKSLLLHVTNKHQWTGNTFFRECTHPPLTDGQIRKKKWLIPGSNAYVALEEVILDSRLLQAPGKLTEFCHTGELEVHHSLMLKYCHKREHFSYNGMFARTKHTALDHNSNPGRKKAVRPATKSVSRRYRSIGL